MGKSFLFLQTGYPIVNVTRNYKNNSAEVTQHRFLKNPMQPKKLMDNDNPCWWVPLSYTTEQELDFNTTEPKTWLECNSTNQPISKEIFDLPEDDEWVIFNVQIAGLYKIRYDEHNWNLLIKQLSGPEYEKISTLNRAALINDALDLAWLVFFCQTFRSHMNHAENFLLFLLFNCVFLGTVIKITALL